ncbi:MAG: phosphoribosylglycinamide formyltransferase [Actinomycetota bacterium]
MQRPRLVVLASGGGSNLGAVLAACRCGGLEADVIAVVSDRAGAGALDRARAAGVPRHHLPAAGRERSDYDAELARLVASYSPDWVVLAGWMRILTMSFLARFPDRVVNLHPALPGELPGVRAIERAWDEAQSGQRDRTGIMVHLVPDEEVDAGPVLGTVEVEIRPSDTLDDLATRMHAAEHRLLVDVLRQLTSPAPTGAQP